MIAVPNVRDRRHFSVSDNGDASLHGNLVENNVAADPTRTASGGGEGPATFNGGERKGEMGNQNDRLNGPVRKVVVQHIKIRCAVFENGAFHLGICGIYASTILEPIGLDWLFSWKGDSQEGQK